MLAWHCLRLSHLSFFSPLNLHFALLPSVNFQEVSSMLLEKLVAAGVGDRPVIFVTHRLVSYIRGTHIHFLLTFSLLVVVLFWMYFLAFKMVHALQYNLLTVKYICL